MSRGRMSFKPFNGKGLPLLSPDKARKKEYLEIKAYDNKAVNKNTDFTK